MKHLTLSVLAFVGLTLAFAFISMMGTGMFYTNTTIDIDGNFESVKTRDEVPFVMSLIDRSTELVNYATSLSERLDALATRFSIGTFTISRDSFDSFDVALRDSVEGNVYKETLDESGNVVVSLRKAGTELPPAVKITDNIKNLLGLMNGIDEKILKLAQGGVKSKVCRGVGGEADCGEDGFGGEVYFDDGGVCKVLSVGGNGSLNSVQPYLPVDVSGDCVSSYSGCNGVNQPVFTYTANASCGSAGICSSSGDCVEGCDYYGTNIPNDSSDEFWNVDGSDSIEVSCVAGSTVNGNPAYTSTCQPFGYYKVTDGVADVVYTCDQPDGYLALGICPVGFMDCTGDGVCEHDMAGAAIGICGGDGTESNPYLVNTCKELQVAVNIQDKVYIELDEDIDCSSTQPNAANPLTFQPGQNFIGYFNGNGYTISNLRIWEPNNHSVALFGAYKTLPAEDKVGIQNVIIDNATMRGNSSVGTLFGSSAGYVAPVKNVIIKNSTVVGSSMAGGMAGAALAGFAPIEGIKVINTNVSANEYYGGAAGGIAGRLDGSISKSYAYDVNVEGSKDVGGIVGMMDDTIVSEVFFSGNAYGGYNVGGIVGRRRGGYSGRIENAYSYGSVVGGTGVGGIASINPIVSKAYSYSDVVGGVDSTNVGGIGGSTVGYVHFLGSITEGGAGVRRTGAYGIADSMFLKGSAAYCYGTGTNSGIIDPNCSEVNTETEVISGMESSYDTSNSGPWLSCSNGNPPVFRAFSGDPNGACGAITQPDYCENAGVKVYHNQSRTFYNARGKTKDFSCNDGSFSPNNPATVYSGPSYYNDERDYPFSSVSCPENAIYLDEDSLCSLTCPLNSSERVLSGGDSNCSCDEGYVAYFEDKGDGTSGYGGWQLNGSGMECREVEYVWGDSYGGSNPFPFTTQSTWVRPASYGGCSVTLHHSCYLRTLDGAYFTKASSEACDTSDAAYEYDFDTYHSREVNFTDPSCP